MKRNLVIGSAFVIALVALAFAHSALQNVAAAQAQGAVMAPRFEVDPTFPKPLPDNMYQGQTIGLWVDAQDHVWIVHRPDVLVGTISEKLLTFALGRGLEHYDMAAVRTIVRSAARDNNRFSSVVLAIVRSVPFQMRTKGES